jgi:hypothetical protein
MEHSAEINELAAALSKAQGRFASVKTDSKAKIPTKAGGSYEYSYASLAATLDAIREPLAANGLAVTQCPEAKGDSLFVVTELTHASGQWLRSEIVTPYPMGDVKALGSAITYLRRYTLTAILGLATEDDDGDAASEHKAQYNRPSPAPKAEAPKAEPKPVSEAQPMHWIDDDATRKKFWAYTRDTLGLTDKEVYAALGVEHIHDYAGDKAAALEAIRNYVRQEASNARVQRRAEELGAAGQQELDEVAELAAAVGGVVAK